MGQQAVIHISCAFYCISAGYVVVAPSQLWDAARSSFFSIWPWKMISSALFPPSGSFRTQLDVLRFLSWINPKVTKSKEMGRTKVLKSVAKDYLQSGQVIKDFGIAIDGQTFFLASEERHDLPFIHFSTEREIFPLYFRGLKYILSPDNEPHVTVRAFFGGLAFGCHEAWAGACWPLWWTANESGRTRPPWFTFRRHLSFANFNWMDWWSRWI